MLGSGLGSRSSFNLRELVGDDDIAPKRKKPKFGLSNAPDKEAESKLKYEYAVEGKWDQQSSGGNMTNPTWRLNPQFNFLFTPKSEKTSNAKVNITLKRLPRPEDKQQQQQPVKAGFYLCKRAGLQLGQQRRLVNFSRENFVSVSQFTTADSISCELQLAVRTEYIVIPMTVNAGDCGRFQLSFSTNVSGIFTALDREQHQWHTQRVEGKWLARSAGGCRHHVTWRNNPQYHLKLREPTIVVLSLTQRVPKGQTPVFMGLYIALKTTPSNSRKMTLAGKDVVAKTLFQAVPETHIEVLLQPSDWGYRLIPSTFEPQELADYSLQVFTDKPLAAFAEVTEQFNEYIHSGEWRTAERESKRSSGQLQITVTPGSPLPGSRVLTAHAGAGGAAGAPATPGGSGLGLGGRLGSSERLGGCSDKPGSPVTGTSSSGSLWKSAALQAQAAQAQAQAQGLPSRGSSDRLGSITPSRGGGGSSDRLNALSLPTDRRATWAGGGGGGASLAGLGVAASPLPRHRLLENAGITTTTGPVPGEEEIDTGLDSLDSKEEECFSLGSKPRKGASVLSRQGSGPPAAASGAGSSSGAGAAAGGPGGRGLDARRGSHNPGVVIGDYFGVSGSGHGYGHASHGATSGSAGSEPQPRKRVMFSEIPGHNGEFQPKEREEKFAFLRTNVNAEYRLAPQSRTSATTCVAALTQVMKGSEDDLLCVGFYLLKIKGRRKVEGAEEDEGPARDRALDELTEAEVVQVFRTQFQPTWEVSKKFVLPPDDGSGAFYVVVPATMPVGERGQYHIAVWTDLPVVFEPLRSNLRIRAASPRAPKPGLGLGLAGPLRLPRQAQAQAQGSDSSGGPSPSGGGGDDDSGSGGAWYMPEEPVLERGVQVLDGGEVSVVRGGRVVRQETIRPKALAGAGAGAGAGDAAGSSGRLAAEQAEALARRAGAAARRPQEHPRSWLGAVRSWLLRRKLLSLFVFALGTLLLFALRRRRLLKS